MTQPLDAIFEIRSGNKLDRNKMTPDPEGVNFVTRSAKRNGIGLRVKALRSVVPNDRGLLTVALGGSALATFLQPDPFYTAQNVAVLSPRKLMSDQEKLYWASCIRLNSFRYSAYGREANRTLASIPLPESVPSWVTDMTILDLRSVLDNDTTPIKLPPGKTWKAWTLPELFEISKGKRLTKANMVPGSNPYVGASEKNNGVTDYVGNPTQFTGHSISLPYDGSIGFACYQADPFLASDAVCVLTPRTPSVSREALLAVCAVLRNERFRFSYGRKWTLQRMKESRISLPAQGQLPDYELLDQFISGFRAASLLP